MPEADLYVVAKLMLTDAVKALEYIIQKYRAKCEAGTRTPLAITHDGKVVPFRAWSA
jgi:hypothetical protein